MTNILTQNIILGFSLIVLVYWLLPSGRQPLFLIVVSFIVLFYFDRVSCAILSIFAVSVFLLTQRGLTSKIPYSFPAMIIFSLIPLCFFKLRTNSFGLFFVNTAIPLGLSFYTLKLIHYWVEYSNGSLRRHTFPDFLNYIFFFPAAAAGPIHRFEEFYASERRKRWDAAMFVKGMERVLYGSCKIIILGNYLVSTRFHGTIESIGGKHIALKSYLSCVEFGLNLYFQFAGYSDIAIGLAMIFGYKISENFSNPFLKPNIVEFWQSWHISLSDWCRRYIFLPVTAVSRRPALAISVSMLVIGLWHKFNMQFIIWGLYHGVGIVIYHRYRKLKDVRLPVIDNTYISKGLYLCAVLVNFNFVMLGFAITKENSLADSLQVFHNIFLSWL
jgi:alginate O-acetyltransferase complex protein AlgI